MTAGVCARESCGEFDIPPNYHPDRRHTATPDIPRPRARLCQQHNSMVKQFVNGAGKSANDHASQCRICQHPEGKRWSKLWVEWVLSTEEVLVEVVAAGISRMSWYRHAEYYNLVDKKAQKINTKRALTIAAERGFAAGGDSVNTALKALQQLSKERGDVEEHRHLHTGVVGTVDLTKLTEKQLAELADRLAIELRKGDDDTLEEPDGDDDEQLALESGERHTITLPASAVKHKAN